MSVHLYCCRICIAKEALNKRFEYLAMLWRWSILHIPTWTRSETWWSGRSGNSTNLCLSPESRQLFLVFWQTTKDEDHWRVLFTKGLEKTILWKHLDWSHRKGSDKKGRQSTVHSLFWLICVLQKKVSKRLDSTGLLYDLVYIVKDKSWTSVQLCVQLHLHACQSETALSVFKAITAYMLGSVIYLSHCMRFSVFTIVTCSPRERKFEYGCLVYRNKAVLRWT